MEPAKLFDLACQEFSRRVEQIKPDQWNKSTPCPDWTVRDLVNHVTGEAAWVAPLVGGKTIADVGDKYDGDILGKDPKATWTKFATEATKAFQLPGAMEKTVQLSYGDSPATIYCQHVAADIAVHTYDLAKGIGADTKLDDELAAFAYATFKEMIGELGRGNYLGPEVEVPEDADVQTKLIALTGRKP